MFINAVKLTVNLQEKSYDIVIEREFYTGIGDYTNLTGRFW